MRLVCVSVFFYVKRRWRGINLENLYQHQSRSAAGIHTSQALPN